MFNFIFPRNKFQSLPSTKYRRLKYASFNFYQNFLSENRLYIWIFKQIVKHRQNSAEILLPTSNDDLFHFFMNDISLKYFLKFCKNGSCKETTVSVNAE